MFQISADISALTKEQRKAVAEFILSYPPPPPPSQVIDNEQVIIPQFSIVEDEGDQSPETAFATSPVPTNEGRLDKNGIPWDERIHASSRVKTADGSWRRKRGVDDATAANVESELKALMGLPAPCTVCNSTAPGHETGGVACIAPVTVVPPPPVAVSSADGRATFVTLISKASASISAGKLTQDELTAAVVAAGVPSLPLLANRLDLVPQVAATIEALIAGR